MTTLVPAAGAGAGSTIPELPAQPAETRSAAPLVAGGLLLVAATTTGLCLTRRTEIAMRAGAVRRPVAASPPPALETETSVA